MTSLVPSDSLRTFLDEASETYHKALMAGEGGAVPWLMSRGVSADSARLFRLGVVASPLPGHERYQGRLAIPYITPTGVVDIRFRCLACAPGTKCDGHAKMLGLPGAILRPYNVAALHEPSPIIAIAEGEPDTWIATQEGIPTVGMPGVASIKEYTPRLFAGYESVFILADNDDGGQGNEFAEKLADKIENVRIALMPSGHDVNSYVLDGGNLKERLGLNDN